VTLPQHRDELALVLPQRLDAAPVLFAQTPPVERPDACAYNRVGKKSCFNAIDDHAHGVEYILSRS
jgi:hypothetical protein